MAAIIWIPVESSNIAQIAYDLMERAMLVQFHNGTIYRYNNVSTSEFNNLREAPSVGKHLAQYIKGVKSYDRIS